MLSGKKNLNHKKLWCEYIYLTINFRNIICIVFCNSDVEDEAVSEVNMIYASQVIQYCTDVHAWIARF